jgi:uncharacterized protein (DUF58 family)
VALRNLAAVAVVWLVALVFALNTGRELAYNLFYFITGAILVALWWARANLRGLDLRRTTRLQRTQVGRYFEETVELANRSRWPKLWVEVRDFSTLPGHRLSRVVNALGRHGNARWPTRTLCLWRGRFTLGPVLLTSGDPLGLFRFRRPLPATTTLLVVPATVPIAEFNPPMGYLAGGDVLRRRTPYVTSTVSGVREYAPGDSINRIHWPSVARTSRLMSKEFELDPLADVWIFLDMHREAQAEGPGMVDPADPDPMPWLHLRESKVELPPSTVEYSVTAAASLAQYFLGRDRAVGFLSYGQTREMLQPDRGVRQLDRLLEVLAVVRAEGNLPLGQVLASEGTRLGRQTMLIAVTASTDTDWVSALRGLRVRGIHSIAVLMAARTFGPAADWAPTLAELQSSAVPTYLIRRGDDLSLALSQPAQ